MTALSDYERYAFDLNGFIVRPNALSETEVASLRAAVRALDVPPAGRTIQSQRFTGYLPRAQPFRDLLDHPAVFEIVRELCGNHVRLDHTYGIVMAPDTAGLSLHSNGAPFDPAQFYAVRDGAINCGLVAVQWGLSTAGPGDGGFCCIPGSHKSDFRIPPEIGLDDPLVQRVPLGPGDVVIFTEALCHGTAQWTAKYDRLTLLYKYSPGNSTWGNEPRLDDALSALLTPRQRRLMEHPYVGGREPT